jgi:23S rRNA (adenine2503-C2)-methyltransferase
LINKINLRELNIQGLSKFFKDIGEPTYRANQVFEGLYKNKINSINELTNLPLKLKKVLEETTFLPNIHLSKDLISIDGTRKMTFLVDESKEIESVWIPTEDLERKTICISSQVGCTLSCAFCATGKLDFKGNLKFWQIIQQIIEVERIVGDSCTNVVFMGMGEPMHNYQNIIEAAHILHNPKFWNIGAKRITISTAGVIPGINRFIDERQPFNLAISLNHPDKLERKEIMGIDEKYPLDDLIRVAKKYTEVIKRRITFEYIVIPGVNNSPKHAKQLIKIAKSINCKINLIPLNTEFNGWRRPSQSEIDEFKLMISDSKVPIMNRRSPGKDIDGACGMLALKG